MSELKRAFSYLRPYAKEATLAVISLSFVVATELTIPRLVQVVIDEGVAKQNLDVIINTSLLMIGASIVSTLFMIGNTFVAIRASRGFEADFRDAIFTKIQSYSFGTGHKPAINVCCR